MLNRLFSAFRPAGQTITSDPEGEAVAFRLTGAAATPDAGWLAISPEALDPAAQERFLVIAQWMAEGRGELQGEAFVVPTAALYLAEPDDLRAVALGGASPLRIGLRAIGRLDQAEFRIAWEFRDPSGKPRAGWRRAACFLEDGAVRYFLSAAEHDLLVALEDFAVRAADAHTYDAHLAAFARIKLLALAAHATLDAYLDKETAQAPEAMGIDLAVDGETLEVRPSIAALDPAVMGAALDTYPRVPTIMTIQETEGGRQRVVLTRELQDGLGQIKRVRRLAGLQRAAFLARPQDFLDPGLIDLADFSDRVRGIGAYQVRYYPLIRRSERRWIPDEIGLLVASDDPAREPVELAFAALEDFEPVEAAYEAAVTEGRASFHHAGYDLPIDGDTEPTLRAVREALALRGAVPPGEEPPEANAEAPMPQDPEPEPERTVLLIHDNEDAPDYVEDLPAGPAARRVILPAALKPGVILLPHQLEGLAFLQHVYEGGGRGVLLGDDMGLGKTLQVLAFLAWCHEQATEHRPFLLVAPVALLENWRAEYGKFLEPIWGPPLELHGDGLRRFRSGSGGREYHGTPRQLLDADAIARHPWVLTTYEAVRDYQFSLAAINWRVVVADEAQKIKTPGALMTNAIKALKTDFRVVATGTPVENSLVDLWCLTDFAQPGLLGPLRAFRAEFDQPRDRADGKSEALVQTLRERMAPVFLRRLKADILADLPARIERPVPIKMSGSQAMRYLELTESYRRGTKGQGTVLAVLRQLRDLSCHPGLLDDEEARVDLRRLPDESPKLAWALQQLATIQARQEKAVLFTESRKLQRLLASLVHQRFGFLPTIVNGEVPGSGAGTTRLAMINDFQCAKGFGAIILSPVAVGFGLTITAANHVIHVTRLWNPAKEDQATDRVHRIGQTRDVQIYYPTSIDPASRFAAFDEILAGLLAHKRELAKNVLFPTQSLELELDELAKAMRI